MKMYSKQKAADGQGQAGKAPAFRDVPSTLHLIADGMMEHNLLRTINDFRADPIKQPHGSTRDRKKNCMFVEVHHKGWPYAFIVLTRDLKGGEEVLIDYGESYWEGHAQRDKGKEFCDTVQSEIETIRTSIDTGLEKELNAAISEQRHSRKKRRRTFHGEMPTLVPQGMSSPPA